MTKKIILLITICLSALNCTVGEHPEFVGMENLKIIDKKFKTFTLSVDAKFKNHNDVGGTLQTDNLKVFVNGIEAANVNTKAFDVPSKAEFTIPMNVKITTDKIININSLEGVFNSLKNKTLDINYKGIINYNLAGFTYSYDVDYADEIKF